MSNLELITITWPKLLLGAAAIGGLIVLAVRTFVQSTVERSVERGFRNWEVRFTALHSKRLEVMESVQDRLSNLYSELESATGLQVPDDPDPVRRKLQQATEIANEFRKYLRSRRFYLPKKLAIKIDDVLKEMQSAWASLATAQDTPTLATDAGGAIRANMWSRGYDSVRKKLPDILSDVEDSFRAVVEGTGNE